MLSPESLGATAAVAAGGSSEVESGDKNDHGELFEVVVYVLDLHASPLRLG